MSCPEISVIIPAWNAAKFLRRAVESLLATQRPNLEIVIVDDASTDETWQVCCGLQRDYPAVIRLYQRSRSEARGAAATRNLGVKESKGEYIAFLDADDWVHPWRFNEPVRILESNPHVDAVYGECDIACAENHELDLHVSATANPLPSNETISFAEFIEQGLWHTSAILVRKTLLDKTGLFDPRFKIGQDSHLWFRMALIGVVRRVMQPASLSVYFRHPGNRYDPGMHDHGRHTVELISVWRWARDKGWPGKADEVYAIWRATWAGNAALMARYHHFETGFKLWKEAMLGLKGREWLAPRLYGELAKVSWAFLRHGVGYWVHRKTSDHRL